MAYPILKPNSSWFTPTTSSVKRDTITTINIVDAIDALETIAAGKASQIDLDNTDARVNELSANVEEVKENILPTVSNADNGKILAVVNGIWTAVSLINSEEVSY